MYNQMSMTDLVFKFENYKLSVIKHDDDVWFRGKTVASILEYKNTKDSLIRHVDSDDKMKLSEFDRGVCETPLSNNEKNTIYINESGLYSLILRSKLEKAKQFKRWVTKDVLPSIRKTGTYTVPQNNDMLLKIEMQKAENDKLRLELEEKKYMKELFDDDDDVKLKAAAKDYLLMKLTGKVQTEDRWARDITEIAKDEFGINLNHTQKCQVGKYIKKKFTEEFDIPIQKTKRWVNGSMRNVNVYPKNKEQWMIDTLRNWEDE